MPKEARLTQLELVNVNLGEDVRKLLHDFEPLKICKSLPFFIRREITHQVGKCAEVSDSQHA